MERMEAMRRMSGAMNSEPFYCAGSWADDELGTALGWTAHRGGIGEHLPLWNRQRDRCLIYCGEHFSHGAGPEMTCNGAVLGERWLEEYEREGTGFLRRFNGWFCGILVDLRERRLFLFNDRYGVSRIFYHETPQGFYFSSEAKALLKVHPETRALDEQGLGEYLSCGCVLQDRTLFRKIRALPPGACWTASREEGVRKGSYFNCREWEEQDQLSGEGFFEALRDTWKSILPGYLQADGPVGLSLTGGVDSRMILAWTRPAPGEMPCYTFCGNFRESNDVILARRLAESYGQTHRSLPIDGDFFANFGRLAENTVRVSDGAMDVTGTLDLHLQRSAREISPVRLSGVYGGEILRKLVVFKPMPVSRSMWAPEISNSMEAAAATYLEERRANPVSFSAFRQAPWHMTGKFAIERSQVLLRSPFFDNEVVKLVYQAPDEVLNSNELSLRLVAEGNPALRSVQTDRGLTMGGGAVTGGIHHLVQQFLFKAEYAYDYGMPQWLARMDGWVKPLHLERLFLGRHGPSHFRVWYRDRLASYLRDVLLDPTSLGRGYLRPEAVRSLVQRHLASAGNHTLEIHKLLSLELIHRQLLRDP